MGSNEMPGNKPPVRSADNHAPAMSFSERKAGHESGAPKTEQRYREMAPPVRASIDSILLSLKAELVDQIRETTTSSHDPEVFRRLDHFITSDLAKLLGTLTIAGRPEDRERELESLSLAGDVLNASNRYASTAELGAIKERFNAFIQSIDSRTTSDREAVDLSSAAERAS